MGLRKKNAPGCRCCTGSLTINLTIACGGSPLGQAWKLLDGSTVAASGTMAGPSVTILGMDAGKTYSFAIDRGFRYRPLAAPVAGSGTYSLGLVPADGFLCAGCSVPLSKTFRVTDHFGVALMTWRTATQWASDQKDSTGNSASIQYLGSPVAGQSGWYFSHYPDSAGPFQFTCPPLGCPTAPLVTINPYFYLNPATGQLVRGTLVLEEVIAGCGTGSYGQPATPAVALAEPIEYATRDRPGDLAAELIVARYSEDVRWAEELTA